MQAFSVASASDRNRFVQSELVSERLGQSDSQKDGTNDGLQFAIGSSICGRLISVFSQHVRHISAHWKSTPAAWQSQPCVTPAEAIHRRLTSEA